MDNDPRELNSELREEVVKAHDVFARWYDQADADDRFPDIPLVHGAYYWVDRVKKFLVIAAGAEEEGRQELAAPPGWKWDYDLDRAFVRLHEFHDILVTTPSTKEYYIQPLLEVRARCLCSTAPARPACAAVCQCTTHASLMCARSFRS